MSTDGDDRAAAIDTLTRHWRTVIGPIHPADSPLPSTTRRTNQPHRKALKCSRTTKTT